VLEGPAPDRAGWAYVSLLSALPGISVSPRVALAIQFLVFEAAAIALGAWYGQWAVVPLATAGVVVSTLGSALMVSLNGRIQRLSPPQVYRRTLFHSSIDVVMGVVAFVAFLTYVLVAARASDASPFVTLLGEELPPLAIGLALLIAWDVCYRIGTAWWVSISGLWRTFGLSFEVTAELRRAYLEIEALTMGFAVLQLLLVPFLWPDRLLAMAVIGHVVAVLIVSGVTAALLSWRSG